MIQVELVWNFAPSRACSETRGDWTRLTRHWTERSDHLYGLRYFVMNSGRALSSSRWLQEAVGWIEDISF